MSKVVWPKSNDQSAETGSSPNEMPRNVNDDRPASTRAAGPLMSVAPKFPTARYGAVERPVESNAGL
jgi:hypothetical protein